MVFVNPDYSSNNDFQVSSGTLQFANRTRMHPGYTENLGISFSAGTFSVTGATAALSSTNPAYVVLPSNANKGQQILYSITAAQTFVDSSGSSTIIGNTFGTTAGVAWGNDMPFYIYAVSNASAGSPETSVNFMISRIPNLTNSPVAGKIAKNGSAVASTQGSMFALGNPTVADYASSPCVCIGSFRMQKTVTTDNWTVSALSLTDGLGLFQDTTVFQFPTGQNGNASGKYFSNNGGTAPVWITQSAPYEISRTGYINYIFDHGAGAITVDGVGAVSLTPNLPFVYGINSLSENQGLYTNNTPTTAILYVVNPSTPLLTIPRLYAVSSSAEGLLNNVDFTAALASTLTFKFSYMVDKS